MEGVDLLQLDALPFEHGTKAIKSFTIHPEELQQSPHGHYRRSDLHDRTSPIRQPDWPDSGALVTGLEYKPPSDEQFKLSYPMSAEQTTDGPQLARP